MPADPAPEPASTWRWSTPPGRSTPRPAACCSAAQPGLAVGRVRGARLRRQLRRPDRGPRPAGRPLDPDPVHHPRPDLLQLPGRLGHRGRDRELLPARVLDRPQLPRPSQVRGLAAHNVATTREFAPDDSFAGIGVYGLERAKMLRGNPPPGPVSVLYPPGATPWITGDGWLPSDLDGNRRPPAGSPNYLVGTQDDEGPYGAPSDAIELFKFFVSWGPSPSAILVGPTQLPVAEFDSDYPCVPPGSRNCIPQPGTSQRIDILSAAADLAPRLPQRRHLRVAGHQPVGRGQAGHRRHALVRAAPPRRPAAGLPAGHLRARRRRQPLGGQHRPGQEGQHGPRLQRLQRHHRVPGHPLHRPAPQRPGQPDAPGRGRDRQRRRLPDRPGRPLGRPHLDGPRPDRQLPLLVVNEYHQTTSARGWQTRIAAFRMPGCT
jgi:hypothetical protein